MGLRIFMILILLFGWAHEASSAGAILVDTDMTGNPVLWKDGIVHYSLESGEEARLGTLSNLEAAQLVRDLFDQWVNTSMNGVKVTNLQAIEGAGLGSVDVSNMNEHFSYCPPGDVCPGEESPFIVGGARKGVTPILFDNDGSMTDAVHGVGASRSILGFAGPRVVDRVDGVLTIIESQAILNGRFIDGIKSNGDPEVSIDAFKGAIFHELGHLIGLDHTQVNLASANKYLQGDTSEKEAIPTMFPIFIDGEAQLTPHFDDKVAIASLYPSKDFSDGFCSLKGVVLQQDTVGLQGVNVVAKDLEDPLMQSTSFVSGAYYKGSSKDCKAHEGNFILKGLIPGRTYTLAIEAISSAFAGGSSIEPCDPPQKGFESKTLPGSFSCSSGAQVIETGTESTTTIVTTKKVSTSSSGSSSDGASGCSLIP